MHESNRALVIAYFHSIMHVQYYYLTVNIQTRKELMAANDAYTEMESKLSSMAEELDSKDIRISEQEKELDELRDCQQYLMSQLDDLCPTNLHKDEEMNHQLSSSSERLLVRKYVHLYLVIDTGFALVSLETYVLDQCLNTPYT